MEAGPRPLSGFSEDVSAYAEARLERLGVQVRTREAVEHVRSASISVAGQDVPVGLVIWAAGVTASPLAKRLGETDKAGRIAVDETSVPGQENVFAIGDLAIFAGEHGRPLLRSCASGQTAGIGLPLALRLR